MGPQPGHNARANLYTTFKLPQNSNCIRLLEILPADTHAFDTSIRANIKLVDLDDKPDFTALSYVWGIDQEPLTIRCDSFDVKVTQNCYDALLHLRNKLGRLIIWVDAICIDQEDENEKFQQISIMQDIYSRANTVYAWLGPGNTRSDRAMAYLARAGLSSYFCLKHTSDGQSRVPFWPWRAACSLLLQSMTCSHHPFPVEAPPLLLRLWFWLRRESAETVFTSYIDLTDIFDREWVKRIWTYQEVLLATNPVVVCGSTHLDWDRLTSSVLFLSYPGINESKFGPKMPNLARWAKLVSSRSRMQDRSRTSSEEKGLGQPTLWEASGTSQPTELYHDFLKRTLTIYMRSKQILVSLIKSTLLVVPFAVFLGEQSWIAVCLAIVLLALAPVLYALEGFGLKMRSLQWFTFRAPEINLKTTLGVPHGDLTDAIASRKCKDPKDKAFGIHGVLQALSADSIPMHSPSDSLEDIYRNFSLNLVQITRSLQHLLAAALHHTAGGPSWIADWSQETSARWWDENLTPTRSGMQTSEQPRWEWDPNKPEQLIVQGRDFGEVLSVLRFQVTTDIQAENEEAAHLHNLDNLSRLLTFCGGSSRRVYSYFTYVVHRDSFMPTQLNMRQVSEWISWCATHRKEPPKRMLHWLKQPLPRAWFAQVQRRNTRKDSLWQTIAHVHVAICNFLANASFLFFLCDIEAYNASIDRNPGVSLLTGTRDPCNKQVALCTTKTEVGDWVIKVPGVSSMLVVRYCRHGDKVRLVSPASIVSLNWEYGLIKRNETLTPAFWEIWQFPAVLAIWVVSRMTLILSRDRPISPSQFLSLKMKGSTKEYKIV